MRRYSGQATFQCKIPASKEHFVINALWLAGALWLLPLSLIPAFSFLVKVRDRKRFGRVLRLLEHPGKCSTPSSLRRGSGEKL